jgi:F-type H+-transporting ATPase subunit gamma
MPSLKSIRKRIASVKNTQKITKAMKMVATAKLRRAQDAVKAIRPYASHLGDISPAIWQSRTWLAEPPADVGSTAGPQRRAG